MPDRADKDPAVLDVLLDTATGAEEAVIRVVAVRAGLLKLCPCGWYNPRDLQRCEDCRRRLIDEEFEPRTPAGIAAHGVLRYLHEVHPDGAARFVSACRDGSCGETAADVAHEVFTEAEHFGYGGCHSVIAWELLAGIDARAGDIAGAGPVADPRRPGNT